MLVATTGRDPSFQQKARKEVEIAEVADSNENVKLIENEIGENHDNDGGLVAYKVSSNVN